MTFPSVISIVTAEGRGEEPPIFVAERFRSTVYLESLPDHRSRDLADVAAECGQPPQVVAFLPPSVETIGVVGVEVRE